MRLGFWQRTAVYVTLAVVAGTGLVWFVLNDVIDAEPGDLQRWSLVLHGISAYAALIVFGSLLPLHVRSGWLRRRNIASGLSVATVMAILSVTALFLYYGGEETREPMRWAHIGIGVLGVALLPLHVMFGHRSRQAKPAASDDRVIPIEPGNRTRRDQLERAVSRRMG